MMKSEAEYLSQDREAIEKLDDFLPDRIFDAHAHIFDTDYLPTEHGRELPRVAADTWAYRRAMTEMLCSPRELRLNMIPFPDRSMADRASGSLEKSDTFLCSQLEAEEGCVGEIMVHPDESAEDIEKRLTHKNIKGLKCYYYLSGSGSSVTDAVGDYLPESAWQAADKHGLCITLHLTRPASLSDVENLAYIRKMAAAYPRARLILAHAARSFAAWTAIEAVEKVADLENVFFDFSAVCESPAMLQIIKKAGIERCMWGSDYPMSVLRGKPISLASGFLWLDSEDHCDLLAGASPWLVGIENLMAVRELATLAELSRTDIEWLFYKNAMSFFGM